LIFLSLAHRPSFAQDQTAAQPAGDAPPTVDPGGVKTANASTPTSWNRYGVSGTLEAGPLALWSV
jgi:hypothetical protein